MFVKPLPFNYSMTNAATQDELSADLLDNARGRVAAAKSTYIK